jgi:hypothetical protein
VTLDNSAPADSGPGGLRAQGGWRRAEELTPGKIHWPALAINGPMASQSNSTRGSVSMQPFDDGIELSVGDLFFYAPSDPGSYPELGLRRKRARRLVRDSRLPS